MLLLLSVASSADEMQAAKGDVFGQPLPNLKVVDQDLFVAGHGIFTQPWVIGPSVDHPDFQGLGPLYNRLSCGACHIKNGRGRAPEDGVSFKTTIVRLSIPGQGARGEPVGDPAYGLQLNTEGIQGVPAEGQAYFNFEHQSVTLQGGENVELQKPKLSFRNLGYDDLSRKLLTSVRSAPPLTGLGLLEMVPDEVIVSLASETGGRPNWVWDFAHNRRALGRFGWKAAEPSVKQQAAMAFLQDIGISSSVFPVEDCTWVQSICLGYSGGKTKELSEYFLAAVTSYVSNLAPPPRRDLEAPAVQRGEVQFGKMGCALCHRPNLAIPGQPDIHPFSDLLLHDMGDGLADGRPDFEAGPKDWRTPPLWGLGLAALTGVTPSYLHDGRARSLAEAILWHGGEAASSAEKFKTTEPEERADLITFLKSL